MDTSPSDSAPAPKASQAGEECREAKDDEAEGGAFQQLSHKVLESGAYSSSVRAGGEDKEGLPGSDFQEKLTRQVQRCGGVRAQGKFGVTRGDHDRETW